MYRIAIVVTLTVLFAGCNSPTGMVPTPDYGDIAGQYAGKDARNHTVSCAVVLCDDDAYATAISFFCKTDSSWSSQTFTLTSIPLSGFVISADTVAESGATIRFYAEWNGANSWTGYHLAVWTTAERDSVPFTMTRVL